MNLSLDLLILYLIASCDGCECMKQMTLTQSGVPGFSSFCAVMNLSL